MQTEARALSDDAAAKLVKRYLAAQLAGNRREALRLLVEEGLNKGVPAQDLQLRVIQAAQYEIGRLWQENRVSIAQEHMATAISQLALAHLYPHLPREQSRGKRVIIACVEGEQHEMGGRIAADVLETNGFDVRYLGASVPTESLVTMVSADPPDVLCLSVTMSFHVPVVKKAIARLREAFGRRVPILVGGHALQWDPALRTQLDADGIGTTAVELCAEVRRLAEAPRG